MIEKQRSGCPHDYATNLTKTPGGLAAGFKAPGWDWSLEKYYHHWFQSDKDVLGLIDEIGARLFELILATASGSKTKSERFGYGQSEFVPWQLGAVM